MTFYGESLPLDDVDALVGPEPTNITYRAGTSPLNAGDDWRAWVYPGNAAYLTDPGEAVAVSWVVEVASGTGTLTAAWGYDPAWGNPAAATPNGLGTHTVTGPATLVLPTVISAADIVTGGDSFLFALSSSSGAVQIQQVKLRVWPTAGITGAWVPYRDLTPVGPFQPAIRAVEPYPSGSVTVGLEAAYSGAPADPEALLEGMQDDLRAQEASATTGECYSVPSTGPSAVVGLGSNSGASVNVGGVSATGEAGAAVARVHLLCSVPDSVPPGTEGVDWINHPDEVYGDVVGYAEVTGPGTATWVQGSVTVVAAPAAFDPPDALPSGATLHGDVQDAAFPAVGPTTWLPIGGGRSLRKSALADYEDQAESALWVLPGPSISSVLIVHDSILDGNLPVRYVDGDFTSAGVTNFDLRMGVYDVDLLTLDPLAYLGIPAPIRYWDPDAVPERYLRQKDRDNIRARNRASRQRGIRQRGYY